ncbi:MAG: AAA family ATPase [Sporomusaceae bacterium]|nr:AAA family ATPase [Sporomusaceae bacterium]
MNIEIRNCNNIDNGTFSIENGRLNIKYAINGTGKSTLAKALKFNNTQDLGKLKPFKYLDDENPQHNPVVTVNGQIAKIAVFDEEYIDRWTFKKNELLENSFDIFVKTPDYDQHMAMINEMLQDITDYFKEDPEIEQLITDLNKFIESFGSEVKKGISKAGPLFKSLGKGNKVEDIPEELQSYAPYLKRNLNSVKWLQWQSQGKDYLDIKEGQCPYCVSGVTEVQKSKILEVSKTYDIKYLKALTNIIEVFESLKQYFTEETQQTVQGILVNTNGIPEEQTDYLLELKREAEGLAQKLRDLKNIGFATLKNVDKIADELKAKEIKLQFFRGLNSDYTKEKIKTINESLEKVIAKAGKLKGEVEKQKRCIAETIEKSVNGINGFLKTAGYKYVVGIDRAEGTEEYRLILKFLDNENNVAEVKDHLSYGEKNAFALVLFMYQTLKDDADFIILDDPISSFDGNKKYAILNKLFRGKNSFQGKTVLMLTHDFEPIIDAVYVLNQMFEPNPAAAFLANLNGIVTEEAIGKEDIRSYIEICQENIKESAHDVHKLIYLRRLMEIMGNKGSAWQMTSNIFHKRSLDEWTWENGEESHYMSSAELTEGSNEIKAAFLSQDFDYEQVNEEVRDDRKLIDLYHQCTCGYEKVQVYRLIFQDKMKPGSVLKKYVDETFHVQNDYLYQLNPRKYKIVPQYILDFCDQEVEYFADSHS